jgi:hypothetical protein
MKYKVPFYIDIVDILVGIIIPGTLNISFPVVSYTREIENWCTVIWNHKFNKGYIFEHMIYQAYYDWHTHNQAPPKSWLSTEELFLLYSQVGITPYTILQS